MRQPINNDLLLQVLFYVVNPLYENGYYRLDFNPSIHNTINYDFHNAL